MKKLFGKIVTDFQELFNLKFLTAKYRNQDVSFCAGRSLAKCATIFERNKRFKSSNETYNVNT